MGVWGRLRSHIRDRPWTVKLFVASIPASWLLLLLDQFSLPDRNNLWNAVIGILLVIGVWMRDRLAWIVMLALLGLSFAAMLVAVASPEGLILLAASAIWMGLLVAAPTWRWINRGSRAPARSGGS